MNTLRKLRINAELSQRDVANSMGYSTPQFISNWERGLSWPPVSDIRKLATLYNCNPDHVFDLVLSERISHEKTKLIREYNKKNKKN